MNSVLKKKSCHCLKRIGQYDTNDIEKPIENFVFNPMIWQTVVD